MLSEAHQRVCIIVIMKQKFPTVREGYKCQAREHTRRGRRVVRRIQGAGCAAEGFPLVWAGR